MVSLRRFARQAHTRIPSVKCNVLHVLLDPTLILLDLLGALYALLDSNVPMQRMLLPVNEERIHIPAMQNAPHVPLDPTLIQQARLTPRHVMTEFYAQIRYPTACPRGTFLSSGQVVCSSCPNATYAYYEGSTNCTYCPIGYECYSRIQRQPCPPGSYFYSTRATQCRKYSLGSYAYHEGSTECIICPSGYQCSDRINAVNCSPGTFSSSGQVVCSPCSSGSYPTMTGLLVVHYVQPVISEETQQLLCRVQTAPILYQGMECATGI
ncbi:unnamed protein product [Rotaria socialis]|uniref:Tyrosine-protein kinase ephrin type A/B receptor-like domain-containing protein n=2 Tax=Rotaria socialis TaxID=392032 RepID=A0A820WMD1_9BILA|nr:unnamed protein product [Rotaria socialis]